MIISLSFYFVNIIFWGFLINDFFFANNSTCIWFFLFQMTNDHHSWWIIQFHALYLHKLSLFLMIKVFFQIDWSLQYIIFWSFETKVFHFPNIQLFLADLLVMDTVPDIFTEIESFNLWFMQYFFFKFNGSSEVFAAVSSNLLQMISVW